VLKLYVCLTSNFFFEFVNDFGAIILIIICEVFLKATSVNQCPLTEAEQQAARCNPLWWV